MGYLKITTFTTISAMFLMMMASVSHASKGHEDKNITVFKTPWCGCCQTWVEAMEKAGYRISVNDMEDLSEVKQQAGVPKQLEACHTAVFDNGERYTLEGHIPIAAVEKLMLEKPGIRGIATPGMPRGSLGMGFDKKAEYTVYAFTDLSSETPAVFYQAGKME